MDAGGRGDDLVAQALAPPVAGVLHEIARVLVRDRAAVRGHERAQSGDEILERALAALARRPHAGVGEELTTDGIPGLRRETVTVAEAAYGLDAAGEEHAAEIEDGGLDARRIDAVHDAAHDRSSERMKRRR